MPNEPVSSAVPPPPARARAAPRAARARVRLVNGHTRIDGYAYGYRQPVLQYEVLVDAVDAVDLGPLDALMAAALDLPVPAEGTPLASAVVERLMAWTTALLQTARHAVLEPPRVVRQQPGPPMGFLVAQPCLHHGATQHVVGALVGLLDQVLRLSVTPERLASSVSDGVPQLIRSAERPASTASTQAISSRLRSNWGSPGGGCVASSSSWDRVPTRAGSKVRGPTARRSSRRAWRATSRQRPRCCA